MDDDFMFNEKQSIRDSARSLKKYGSTCCNHIRNNETLIRHYVEKTDTLQGIALKYGCTTEQIRRANRLFASDSLFLRQFLLVPVEKNSPYFPQDTSNEVSRNSTLSPISDILQNEQNSISSTTSSSSSSSTTNSNSSSDTSGSSETLPSPTNINQHNNSPRSSNLPTRPYSIAGELLIQANDDDPAALNQHNHNNCSNNSTNKQSKSLDSVAAMTPEDENRKCINDFLNKIDTTISESRKYVEKSKEMLKSQSDDDLFVVNTDFVEQKRNNHLNGSYKNNNNNNNSNRQLYGNHQRHSSNGSGTSDTAHLLNTTQLRRVQNSLKRLEKQQDEFFEL